MTAPPWKYPLRLESLNVGGQTPLRLWVVDDPEVVLEDAVEAERRGEPATLPFWATLWASGIEVARWATAHVRPGQRVLDLGCGMGTVGCAALRAGAEVTFADIEPDAVALAGINAARIGGVSRGTVLDLRSGDLGMAFDLILGGDVLYDRDIVPPLRRFLHRHLAPGGVALLGDPHRHHAEAFLDERCVVEAGPKVRLIRWEQNEQAHA